MKKSFLLFLLLCMAQWSLMATKIEGRVVNSKGLLAGGFAFGGEEVQARFLREEGVEVINGKVDLKRFGIRIEQLS